MTGRARRPASAAVARVLARVRAFQAGARLAHLKRAAGAARAVATELPFRTALAARAAVGRVTLDRRARSVAVELSAGAEPGAAPTVAQHAVRASRSAAAAMGRIRRDRHAAIVAALLSRGAVRRVELAGVRALNRRGRRSDLTCTCGPEPEHESRHEPHPNAKPTRKGPRCARQDRRRRCHAFRITEPPPGTRGESAEIRQGATHIGTMRHERNAHVVGGETVAARGRALNGFRRSAVSACACEAGAA